MCDLQLERDSSVERPSLGASHEIKPLKSIRDRSASQHSRSQPTAAGSMELETCNVAPPCHPVSISLNFCLFFFLHLFIKFS